MFLKSRSWKYFPKYLFFVSFGVEDDQASSFFEV